MPRTKKSLQRTLSRYQQYQQGDTASISEASFQYDIVTAATMNGWRIDLSHALDTNDSLITRTLMRCFPTHGLAKVRAFLLGRKKPHFTLAYHTHNSEKSQKGYPDLTLVHPETGRVIFYELKDDKKYPSTEQRLWAAALMSCSELHPEAIIYRLIRPRHYLQVVQELGGIDPLEYL